MRRIVQSSCVVLLLLLAARPAVGFSLLGPYATWQTTASGYVDFTNIPNDQNGGAMNLGEGYRWTVPTIYYAYSPDFMHYFGTRGAVEIDKVIKILNDLPAMDSLVVTNFPLQSQRVNYRASALGLYDLKSVALSYLVHDLGLTDPTRNVFTARNRYIIGNTTNYVIVKRNFDPVTFEPTAFINGQLWTYTTIVDPATPAGEMFVNNEPVDPLALGGLINAPVSSDLANNNLRLGGFWTGLTQDDVGGLRYLYRKSNLNVETLPPNATLFTPGTAVISSGGSAGGSPWTIPDLGTNTTTTGTATGVNSNVITTALRPGIGKVNFVRIDYSSTFGAYPSNNVSWADRVLTNGTTVSQTLVRPLLAPDLVFDAQDLQAGDASVTFPRQTSVLTLQSNDAINGLVGTDGPGQILPTGTVTPGVVLAFNKVGPAQNNSTPFFLSEVNSTPSFAWGSFDGSANDPVLYPSGASILAAEQAALTGKSSGSSGTGSGSSSLVGVWTPTDYLLPAAGATTGTGTGAGTGTGTSP